ncbi:hypothetical protein L484_002648 [Morus notabilis]|uniref:Uncharacterized protein n=1 Tax=Morus notabilis TaxID=981085 RepID=W9SVJ8_9ROSA|nr:hypothetical protein L484_002648 [Morus notabilis]
MARNSSRPSFSLADLRSSLPHEQPSFNIVYNMPTINYFQPQHRIIPNFPHPIVAFIIPVILHLIELQCQCKANSPFETNPVTMWFGVSCLLAYCLAYGIELRIAPRLRSPNCSDHSVIRYGSSLFGSLCLASLTSLLLPSMKPLLYGFYGLLSIGGILQSYKIVWNSIDKSIVINFFRPCRGQVERDLLPV